jgi:surface polysaccharide O-acyltransferase-like enzyme
MKVRYFDYLRVISIVAVVLLHSFSHYSDAFGQILFSDWANVSIANAFLRFCVPVFFMVSGALNLDSEKSFDLKKRLWKIVIPLIGWSFIYLLYRQVVGFEISNYTFWSPIKGQVFFHLWFVYILAGLYLFTPFIRKMVENKSLARYFLILWIIWSVILPTLNIFFDAIPYLNLDLYAGFLGWYILGYYLHQYYDRPINSVLLFLGYIFTSAIIAGGTYVLTVSTLTNDHNFYSNLNFFVVLQAICIFLIFKNGEPSFKYSKLIQGMSDVSFSIYFAHALALQVLFDRKVVFNDDILLNALTYGLVVFAGLTVVLLIIRLIKIKQNFISYAQLAVVVIISGYFMYLGNFKFFVPNLKFNFDKLTVFSSNLQKTDEIYLSFSNSPSEYQLTSFNLNLQNQRGIVRIAVPTHLLESYAPVSSCNLYVPDNQTPKNNLKHNKFSKTPQLSNYNVSADDVFSQLICEDAQTVELRFNNLDKIYLFYY